MQGPLCVCIFFPGDLIACVVRIRPGCDTFHNVYDQILTVYSAFFLTYFDVFLVKKAYFDDLSKIKTRSKIITK